MLSDLKGCRSKIHPHQWPNCPRARSPTVLGHTCCSFAARAIRILKETGSVQGKLKGDGRFQGAMRRVELALEKA